MGVVAVQLFRWCLLCIGTNSTVYLPAISGNRDLICYIHGTIQGFLEVDSVVFLSFVYFFLQFEISCS